MDLGLKNRVALVAAASRGIGFACARELAREGARVFLCSRDAQHASEAAEKIHKETGADVAGIACDVTNDTQVQAFVNLAIERAGRIDICVTNAGGPPAKTFAETDLDTFRRAFELNALSAIRFAKLVLPGMLEGKWGRIINITSVSVKQPIDGLMLSNATRLGVIGWAKTLSRELAAQGITVNNVCPGNIATGRLMSLIEERARRQGVDLEQAVQVEEGRIPMGVLGEPEDVANLVVFLASVKARYITGTTVQVDGGSTTAVF